ncbi:hypothetical protein TUM17576_49750 [Enterobacter hormaechei]|nr:hypothetical protein [Enterobacter hormaechei]GJL38155.1 hypothetical protein TUM17576_49750 [Enterobacter hormaechei]
MKAESQSQGHPLHLDPLSDKNVLVPPFVKTIAVRLSWVAAGDENELYQLLSRPYYEDGVSIEYFARLSARLPFVASQQVPLAIADYTILLVTVWLTIEELYHRGVVLPEQIMQELMEKATTLRAHDCRKENREHGDMCQHQ